MIRALCVALGIASLAIAVWFIVEPSGEFNGVAVVWTCGMAAIGIYGGVRG